MCLQINTGDLHFDGKRKLDLFKVLTHNIVTINSYFQLLHHCFFGLLTDVPWQMHIYRVCVKTLIPVCVCVYVSHNHPWCVCWGLCPSFTVVWGHSWLMAVNSTSVKASECGQLKSCSAPKDGWPLLVQRGELLFNSSHFSFLMQCPGLNVELNRPLQLKSWCSTYWSLTKSHFVAEPLKTCCCIC